MFILLQLGESCLVRGSTVGANCVLKDHCTVNQSHLWANVTVEANAVVDHAILCDGNEIIIKTRTRTCMYMYTFFFDSQSSFHCVHTCGYRSVLRI